MLDYLLLMHADAQDQALADNGARWEAYLQTLRGSGCFDGGSAIGAGQLCRKAKVSEPIEGKIVGFLRVRAVNLEDAARFLDGNPVFDAGGTVEIRELPRD